MQGDARWRLRRELLQRIALASPRLTAFTRTPLGPYSTADALVRRLTVALLDPIDAHASARAKANFISSDLRDAASSRAIARKAVEPGNRSSRCCMNYYACCMNYYAMGCAVHN
jgi:hypothetical protein